MNSLRSYHLIKVEANRSVVQSEELYWGRLKCIQERNFIFIEKVVTTSLKSWSARLIEFEFHSKVALLMTILLVPESSKLHDSVLVSTWLNLNFEFMVNFCYSPSINMNLISSVFKSFV